MAFRIPGIVVRILNDAGVVAPPVFQRYPVIIGEGDPYKLVENVVMTRTIGSVDPLPSVTTINEIVTVGDLPGITNYTDGTDYTLSTGNRISWLPGGSSPTTGDEYYISWTETRPASAYAPTLYLDENLVYADHGLSLRTNGNINDVSVGASLALNAGAFGVVVAQLDLSSAVDPDAPTNSELETAFIATRTKCEQITDAKLFMVPMSSGTLNTTSAAALFFNQAVVLSQPEYKQERTVIMSLPVGMSYTAAATTAQSYAHERMVVPAVKNTTVSVAGFSGTYDMRFYAASLSGLLCSVSIGRTVSDEVIPNITFDDNYSVKEANYLVQRGVSPGKISGDIARNIMAITTDTTSALTEDLGVQDVKDYVKVYWREALWNVFKNQPINSRLISSISSSSVGILKELQKQEIISDYRSISASQDPSEPRKVNVFGKIQPAYGLQWMDVTFVFVLSFSA
jgi:hypothetical protein